MDEQPPTKSVKRNAKTQGTTTHCNIQKTISKKQWATNTISTWKKIPQTQESKGEKSTKPARQTIDKKWEIDPSISQLSAAFVTNLQVEQEKLLEAREDLEDVTK